MHTIATLFPTHTHHSTSTIIVVDETYTPDAWAKTNAFTGTDGQVLVCVNNTVLVGAGNLQNPFFWAGICKKIPAGTYIAPQLTPQQYDALVIGWALQHYTFTTYKKSTTDTKYLILDESYNRTNAIAICEGIYIARDLINTPANDMTPSDLAQKVTELGSTHNATVSVISGEHLKNDFPLIHTVGRASANAPCLIELNWGNTNYPLVTLVGKGITFDSGGLDIKPSSAMLNMKKDMGGSANVIGLAHMIMATKMPIQLRLIVASAENMIGSQSFRPRDILRSRHGLSVEIGNTDAEGRLVLADALSYAEEKTSDLLIDMATLTGAARVAVGADVPAFFTRNDTLAQRYYALSNTKFDYVWRMPLHQPYRTLLDSPIADIISCATVPLGGAITAGLFLQEFVKPDTNWVHIDLMAYNTTPSNGRPVGGEAMGIRGLFAYLQEHYCT